VLVLITYDVNTETESGRRRLRKIAKQCVNYGQRVQCSVFECDFDAALYRKVQNMLVEIIDPKKDSLRFYNLGNHYQKRVEHFGIKAGYDAEGTLIV